MSQTTVPSVELANSVYTDTADARIFVGNETFWFPEPLDELDRGLAFGPLVLTPSAGNDLRLDGLEFTAPKDGLLGLLSAGVTGAVGVGAATSEQRLSRRAVLAGAVALGGFAAVGTADAEPSSDGNPLPIAKLDVESSSGPWQVQVRDAVAEMLPDSATYAIEVADTQYDEFTASTGYGTVPADVNGAARVVTEDHASWWANLSAMLADQTMYFDFALDQPANNLDPGETAVATGDDVPVEAFEKIGADGTSFELGGTSIPHVTEDGGTEFGEYRLENDAIVFIAGEAPPESRSGQLAVEIGTLGEAMDDIGDSDIDATTLESLQEAAGQRADLDRALVDDFLDARDALRFSEVRLITDFPITTVVYGYSRTEAEPSDGVFLRTFPGEGGGDRMFAMTAEAEAVMFSLDPEAVIDWLDLNDILHERPEENVEQWLLERLRQYPYFREVDPAHDGPAARYTLTLLHTMSHLVINGVDALSGYSKSSLIEYLLPHTLSFVVYKHTDTDYSLGAMHTLAEKRFRELGDYIQNEGDVCIYDPVCEHEENAACEDCLYISNIACDNGNHNLSRSTLYGGEFDGETIAGFLDV